MRYWLKIIAAFAAAAAIFLLFIGWFHRPEQRYLRIRGGMTVTEVEAVFSRPCDADELSRWSRQGWNLIGPHREKWIWVRFDDDGRAAEKWLINGSVAWTDGGIEQHADLEFGKQIAPGN